MGRFLNRKLTQAFNTWMQTAAELAEQQRTTLIIALAGAGVLVLGLVCGCGLWIRLKDAEARALQLQEEKLRSEVKEQERELTFHRNWRIKESEVELQKELASGAEGEVCLV